MSSDGIREWYAAKDLAGLPGMPGTERRVRDKGDREGWTHREVTCRGGRRREYHVRSLPEDTRAALAKQCGERGASSDRPGASDGSNAPGKAPAPLPALRTRAPAPAVATGGPLHNRPVPGPCGATPPASISHLKGWQRECMDARLAFIREVERREVFVGVTRAVHELVAEAAEGALPETLQRLLPVANARTRSHGALSRGTVFGWLKAWREGGLCSLAPAPVENPEIPEWAPLVLGYYQRPQRPSVAQALEWLAKDLTGDPGAEVVTPSVHQVRRFLRTRMSAVDREKGRLGRAEMGRITWYWDRDTGASEPFSIGLCDGHSAKFRVRNWRGRRAFHPELCGVLDAVTRYVPGWSVGFAESAWTVGEAVIHAATVTPEKPIGGIFAILYTDLGSGNKAKQNTDEVTGLFARLGTTHETGLAGNPRGRGRIERLQASLWIRAAKELPSYTGKDVNRDFAKRIYRVTEKDLNQKGESVFLPDEEALLAWAAAAVHAYNHRPHSRLPVLRATATSQRRHLSPAESIAEWLERGWRPVYPGPAELAELQRPMERVNILNGMFSLFGNRYGDPCLKHYHGHQLFATLDVHDGSKVRVYDEEHRFLCEARFEANKQRFFPESKEEQALAGRAKRRLALKQSQMEEILAERDGPGPKVIDVTPEELAAFEAVKAELLETKAEQERRAAEEAGRLIALPVPDPRETLLWASPAERYEWLLREKKHRDLTPDELLEIEDYRHYALTGERLAR